VLAQAKRAAAVREGNAGSSLAGTRRRRPSTRGRAGLLVVVVVVVVVINVPP
jgi:hypothetical protein